MPVLDGLAFSNIKQHLTVSIGASFQHQTNPYLRGPFPNINMSMHITRLVLFCLVFLSSRLAAQGFEDVFPGLNGAELIDSVASHYRPATVLDYANSRDTLYAKILAFDDDSIRCVYSGHTLYLDPTQDPTQYIYQNGGSNGMNTEHAYPQSKGAADGNARSDMHHLYPARIPVNEARGDFPYADIPDAQTQKWFRGNQVQTNIPSSNIDAYAEFKTGSFEPRESMKGDLARSVFYFYTMYRAQANLADPNYFELQRATLCQWAYHDPADSAELLKTWRIAPYQEGKPNPFVLDCTLARRCWCPELPADCVVGTSSPSTPHANTFQVWPNPAHDLVYFKSEQQGPVSAAIYDVWGRVLMQQVVIDSKGVFSLTSLKPGLYMLALHSAKAPVKYQPIVVD